MKLIDADEAFRILSDYYHHRTETQADALREALDRVPEAVVRCKDCINNILGENYNPLARHKKDCIFKPDNWFCADGEGKTDDE